MIINHWDTLFNKWWLLVFYRMLLLLLCILHLFSWKWKSWLISVTHAMQPVLLPVLGVDIAYTKWKTAIDYNRSSIPSSIIINLVKCICRHCRHDSSSDELPTWMASMMLSELLLLQPGNGRAATPTRPSSNMLSASRIKTNALWRCIIPSITKLTLYPKYWNRRWMCFSTYTTINSDWDNADNARQP